MTRGAAWAAAVAETAGWAVVLLAVWILLVSTVDRGELLAGGLAALLAGAAARGARRAVAHR